MALSDRPVMNLILYKEDGTPVTIDSSGILTAATPGHAIGRGLITSSVNGLAFGYVATSATTIVAVRATSYTEPASAMQMELVSSSANDASAGTGARTVRVTYFDGSMDGPFTEDITLNGTTPVDTVATNIRFIEKMETLTVGSNGTNVGTISIRETDGSPTYASIAASDGITYLAHHYVAAGRRCCVTRIITGTQGASSSVFMRYAHPLTANGFESQITPSFRTITAQPSQIFDLEAQLWLQGPGRLSLWTRPDAATANTCHAGFAYYEL